MKYFFAFSLFALLSACVSVPSEQAPGAVVTDETFGRYHENLESNLILITMTLEYHARYTELKAVPMSVELPPLYRDFLVRMEEAYGLKRVANWPLPAIDVFCIVFEVKTAGNRSATVAALEQEPDIETAQIVQTFDLQSQPYNDPYLSLQHGVHSIDALSSHQWTRGKGIRIAVIDTGIDDTHPDLVTSSEATRNFVDSDEVRFRTDTHGTAVGGIIAAAADNSKARCNTLTLAKALNFAIEQKVDIINLSLTGPPDPVLERLVLEALSDGIVVVGAKPAHNGRAFPVSIPGTVVVAMPDTQSQGLSAPGINVLSTLPNEDYAFFDGSSFSAAHITGIVALLRSVSPALTPSELLALLERTAHQSTGAVNACRAVEVLINHDDETDPRHSCITAQLSTPN